MMYIVWPHEIALQTLAYIEDEDEMETPPPMRIQQYNDGTRRKFLWALAASLFTLISVTVLAQELSANWKWMVSPPLPGGTFWSAFRVIELRFKWKVFLNCVFGGSGGDGVASSSRGKHMNGSAPHNMTYVGRGGDPTSCHERRLSGVWEVPLVGGTW